MEIVARVPGAVATRTGLCADHAMAVDEVDGGEFIRIFSKTQKVRIKKQFQVVENCFYPLFC